MLVDHGEAGKAVGCQMPVTAPAGSAITAWLPRSSIAMAGRAPAFLGTGATADIVTYHHDPWQDPAQLAHPATVVAGGTRLR